MRVNIDRTVEVTDEQRALIAKKVGQKTVTRAELQDFIWTWGAGWAEDLVEAEELGDPAEEDLLGVVADAEAAPEYGEYPGNDPNDLL